MPRLTNQRYLLIHRQLRRIWREDPECFAWLSAPDQWVLHDFFKPAKALSDIQLLAHRRDITQQRPSLPQQAGRALARLYRAAQSGQRTGQVHCVGEQHILVRGLVRPEIDAEALAHVLVSIAKDWEQNSLASGHNDRTGAIEDDLAS